MTKIFWTYKHFVGEAFEDHPHYGKYCVVALSPTASDTCWCFTGNNEFIHNIFDSEKDAKFFATEGNKPFYFETFGLNYELIYMDSNSTEWYEVYNKWNNFVNTINEIKEFISLPWYKKLFHKIIKF